MFNTEACFAEMFKIKNPQNQTLRGFSSPAAYKIQNGRADKGHKYIFRFFSPPGWVVRCRWGHPGLAEARARPRAAAQHKPKL